METNLRSLVALVLLLVPFLAGKFVHVLFYYVLYIPRMFIYTLPISVVVVLQLYFLPFIFSVLNEDKALSRIISYVAECTHQVQLLSSPQLPSLALMEQFVWLVDQWRVQAGWRSASMECGEESV